jgi:hypothetical protein
MVRASANVRKEATMPSTSSSSRLPRLLLLLEEEAARLKGRGRGGDEEEGDAMTKKMDGRVMVTCGAVFLRIVKV